MGVVDQLYGGYDPGVPAEANRGNAPVLRGKGGFARAVRRMTESLAPGNS